mgnify:CR=1 FL=1
MSVGTMTCDRRCESIDYNRIPDVSLSHLLSRKPVHLHHSCSRLLLVAYGLALACPAIAEDYFLVVGGGPSPFNNQVSLESNVLFSQRVLAKVRDDAPEQQFFFADGNIDKPDLQYLNPDARHSQAVIWMSRLFGDEDSMNYCYRDHQIEHIDGPTRKGFLKQAFFELAEQAQAGDRLIVYVTAHGGEAEGDDYYSDTYYDRESLAGSIILQWPALESGDFSPLMNQLTTSASDEFVRVVESQPQCDSFRQAEKKADELDKRLIQTQHREAKMRRLLRVLENILLEKNLPHHGSAAQLEHFDRMMTLQQQGIAAVTLP